MIKDTEFYNKESRIYSRKRYPAVPTTYVHFFFLRRLELALRFLRKIKPNPAILEMGCADGHVLRTIEDAGLSDNLIGIDLSPEMIQAAKEFSNGSIAYFIRGQEPADIKADAVLEIGVVNFTNFENELEYAYNHLNNSGYYIVSVAGKSSLKNILRSENSTYAHLEEYPYYERRIAQDFEIIAMKPYGLFIPLIWKSPALARIIQPALEKLLSPIIPNLFHERIFLARKKGL